MDDQAGVVLSQRDVIEIYDGEVADGRLVERITIVDGVEVSRETFDPDHPEEG